MATNKSAKGLPKRTSKTSTKMKTARHFGRALEKKYRRVKKREGKDKADAWKLAKMRKAVGVSIA